MNKHMVTSVNNKWFSNFFDDKNVWSLPENPEKNYPACFEDSLSIMLEHAQDERLPAILPRWKLNNKHFFYIVAFDFRQLGELNRIVQAVFGETYLAYSQVIISHADDDLETLLLQQHPIGFLRLQVQDRFSDDVIKITELMVNLNNIVIRYRDRPLFRSAVKRPTARILRDFRNSINFGDGIAAEGFKKELASRKLLSPLNLISLELQALATSGRWADILSDKKRLNDVIKTESSWRVNLIILRALRVNTIAPVTIESHSSIDVVTQNDHLQSLFFKSPYLPHDSKYDEEWMCWSIGATAFGFDSVTINLPKQLINNGWDHKLKEWVSPSAITDDRVSVETAALDLINPSIDSAWNLLKTAFDVDKKKKKEIYGVLSKYPKNIIDALESDENRAFIWEHLKKAHGKFVLNHWNDVLVAINKNIPLEEIQEELDECMFNWGKRDWDEIILSSLIQNERTEAMRDLLPQILSWLYSHSISISKNNSLIILLSLASDEARSPQDIVLCGDLIRNLTECSLLASDYTHALDCLQEVWDGDNGAKRRGAVNYYLDVIDVLADAACGDLDRRVKLWNVFQEFLIKQWEKLDEAQKLSAVKLAEDLIGTSKQFPSIYINQEPEDSRETINLSGKQLAIYSLTEGAGRRAASVIGKKYPGLAVVLNNDKTATSSLLNLADKASFFVFAAKSAAHQAFYPVSDRRKDLIYPDGKGSTSIIRAFVEYVDSSL